MKQLYKGIFTVALIAVMSGCGSMNSTAPVNSGVTKSIETTLIDTAGEQIGEAHLTENDGVLTISLKAEGLEPGTHGIHLHEKGVCTPPDFKSAGGHFNPTDKEHGFDNPKGYHLGDLPNLEVGKNGKVAVQLSMHNVVLQPGKPNSLLDEDGSALVIHAGPDDYKTDPAGNSGDRIACGEIKERSK
ncbi:superoxide dismutase family protein [Sporosarcina aquimarina]|uniref:Superoxide dismutase [Cu-Zn] n=1 Tax=Sporosarcina aquimarina TaxID=114975 RepID=A0ABU4G0Z7_9BACL|nr:superoxide dismutase family protein [Sporosarcina aquimarina]MDW0110072.1 superoxide dismutase family protein [Sporosarcina aquimarina]